ncbi:hypothetical protein [Sphingomonas sp.]|uniref:hypothetical protein n=1 Tax=Sphingomonas sp. TaxID=28214 RepID=UPI002DD625E1|nr:hypothetical protein [Sphingomonas sp.]
MAASVVVAGLLVYIGNWNEPASFVLMVPFSLWVVGPILAPGLIARRSRPTLTHTMCLYIVPSVIIAGMVYYEAAFTPSSSTAALIFIFLPAYQWAALGLLTLLAMFASRYSDPR